MTSEYPPQRGGKAGLEQQLSGRDLAVLRDVARFRLMSGRQLQQLHFGDDENAARAARRLLARLSQLHVLARLPRRVGGVRAGSQGYVFGVGPAGDRLLSGRTRHRATDIRDGFLNHTLAISQLYVGLASHADAGHVELLSVEAEPASWRRLSTGDREWLKPDLAVITARGEEEWHHWVEVDLGTEHRPAVLRKLRLYETAYRAGDEAASRGVFPRVLWVAPDDARVRLLGHLASNAPGITGELHAACLPDQAVPILSGEEPPPTPLLGPGGQRPPPEAAAASGPTLEELINNREEVIHA